MSQGIVTGWVLAVVLGLLTVPGSRGGDRPGTSAGPAPAAGRSLTGADASRAAMLAARVTQLFRAGDFAAAIVPAQQLRQLCEQKLGKRNWQAVDARLDEAMARQAAGYREADRKALADSYTNNDRGVQFLNKGRFREAQPLLERALATRRRLLGEEHADTATSYNNLAGSVGAQGKYAEAEASYRKALGTRQKLLGEEHPNTATSCNNLANNLEAQGRYAEAAANFRKALALRRKLLGEEHPDTAASYNNLATNLNSQGRYAEAERSYRKALALFKKLLGEEHSSTATAYNNLAHNQEAQGKYTEAEAGFRKALALRRKLLGEEHPETAASYNNLAANLNRQGRYTEAEANLRKALTLFKKRLGEDHPLTVRSYNNLAVSLQTQGKYGEAEVGLRRVLTFCRKLLGEEHPATADVYSSLAGNLHAQGKYAEAETGYRKALTLNRKLLGEEHPTTAASYNNLAVNLNAQGKHAEAEQGLRKALALRRKVLGEEHPLTADSYNNLAATLEAQGKVAEAETVHRKALALRQKLLGQEHRLTADSYNNLAANLNGQGKVAEAEAGYRKALALHRKLLGEEHPDTATGYNNLGFTLHTQGKFAQADEPFRKALALRRKLLGEDHPLTASSYNNLAHNLHAQGKYAEAEKEWDRAAVSFGKARLRFAHAGLDRAARTGEDSPLPALAAVLARNGKPDAAWDRFEQSLACSTRDDLAARLRRAPADQQRLDQLLSSLERLDRRVAAVSARPQPTAADEKQRDALLRHQRQKLDELAALRLELEKKGGVAEGVSLSLAQIQKALPPDAALVGWLDRAVSPQARDPSGEHWGVVVRSTGAAIWVRLKGSGPGGRWNEADSALPGRLRQALASLEGEWQRLAGQLRQQRMEPLAASLRGAGELPAVRQLLVLPSAALAGIPVELLAEGRTVSYTPSGTILAHLRGLPRLSTVGLLALADPIFDRPKAAAEPLLPSHGLLVTFVTPCSNGARAGLRPGDVLLTYDGTELRQRQDLKPRPEGTDADARVKVILWRGGKALRGRLRPGKLGVVLADDPAPIALAESRRRDRHLLAASRGGDDDLAELPGTRVEAAWLARLFQRRKEPITLLLDSDASEQKLHALAAAGTLKTYRYLHLATHGAMNDRFPLQSALRLARDHLPDPAQQLAADKPLFDGRLTAAEVLRDWKLDAELVTLSACQSGLGKYERGEGYVGFAQALLLAGARSVCLSLWKVDDGATALLMGRFYQNLLGQRAGLQ